MLILDILNLSVYLAEAIKDEADKNALNTEEAILDRLQQVQLMLQNNEINEEEYEEAEEMLIARLKNVREDTKGVHIDAAN